MNAQQITEKIFNHIHEIEFKNKRKKANDTDNSDGFSGIDKKRLIRIVGSLVSDFYYSVGGNKEDLASELGARLSMNGWSDEDIGIVLQNNFDFTHDLGAWEEIERLPDFLVSAMSRAFSESIPRAEHKLPDPISHSFNPMQTEFGGDYDLLVSHYGPGKGYMLWNIADMFASKAGTEVAEKWAKVYKEIEASPHV